MNFKTIKHGIVHHRPVKRNAAIWLVAAMGTVWLLFGTASNTPGLHAQDNHTPTPSPTTPTTPVATVLAFSEHSDDYTGALTFTIKTDGTAILEMTHYQKNGEPEVIWQQSGLITPEQLTQVDTLPVTLGGLADQFQPDRSKQDVTFVFDIAGKHREISLGTRFQAYDKPMVKTLQAAADVLAAIRKPFETLVIFEWTGGFAGRSTVLSVQNDGSATFEDRYRKTVSQVQFTQEQLDEVRKLLQGKEFLNYTASPLGGCSDCWEFTITGMTAKGIHVLHISDGDMMFATPPVLVEMKRLVGVLQNLHK